MKKASVWKWITAIGMGLAFLFAFLIPMGGGALFGSQSNGEGGIKNKITAEAVSLVDRPGGETFGQFPNGYVYAYTEKTLANNLHAGSGTTDLKSQTVNTIDASKRGTAENPYVIENTTDWENFAKFTYNSASRTSGKVFVLARDIDFSAVQTFRFIPSFSGSFYGLGHKLSNITISTWQYWNGASVSSGSWAAVTKAVTFTGYGLFGLASNASITDLSVENFLYSSVTSFTTDKVPWANFVGGLAGTTSGTTFIGNCHLQGKANLTFTQHAWWGGIVGMHTVATSTTGALTIYRCSADTVSTLTINTKYNIHDGAIIGDVGEGLSAVLYDCVANRDTSNTTNTNQTGGLVGYLRQTSSFTLENVVCYTKFTKLTAPTNNYGACFGYTFNDVSVKNVWLMSYNGSAGTASTPFNTVGSYKATGVTVVGPNITGAPSGVTPKTSNDAVITAAKDAVGTTLSNKIWNSAKFTTAGMGTFTPDESPVRNHLVQIPLNHEVEYTGEKLDVTGADWYAEDVHGDTDIMTIDYPAGGMTYVSDGYIVNFTLKNGYVWSDGTTGAKQITVKVNKKEVGLIWDTTSGIAVAEINSDDLALRDRGTSKPKLIFTYFKEDGTPLDPENPAAVPDKKGYYVAKATLNTAGSGRNYTIKKADIERGFQLSAVPINTPTVSGELEQMYTGEDIVFTLVNDGQMGTDSTNDKIVEITQADMPAGATYKKEGDTRTITVKNVGEYSVPFTLYDQSNNCWGEGGGVLNLVVTQRPLLLTIGRPGGAGWQFETNTNESFTITHNALGSDNIRYNITYDKPNGGTVIVGDNKITTEGKVTTVTLDPLDTGVHTIRVELATAAASNANGNYLANVIEQEVEVVGKTVTIGNADIIWQYSDGRTNGLLADLTDNQIDYTGRTFTVSLKADGLAEKGVQVKEYVEGRVGETLYNSTGLNAGVYKTKVVLTKLNETYNFTDREFEVTWKIMKVKFDLTDVHWSYEGPIGYTGSPVKVQLENLPSALSATYSDNIKIDVTGAGHYKAEVSLKLKNESADSNNYVLPTSDRSTYKYTEGENFPWTLEWQITQGVIDLAWDLDGEDGAGAGDFSFIYPVLLGGGKYVDYEFYEALPVAGGGFEPASNPTLMGEIVSPDNGGAKNYFVKAVFSSEAGNNFVFGAGTNPRQFSLEDYRTGVTVTVAKAGGKYSGEAQPIEFTTDFLSPSDFEVTYLDANGIRLSGAPVNAGKYTARIAVKGDKSATHYVKNRTVKFEITKFTIAAADLHWDYDSANPFEFTLVKEGSVTVEKLHAVKLANVPTTLSLIYTDNEFSAAGNYVAMVEFGTDVDTDNIDISNFWSAATGKYEIPAAIKTLNWEITKHVLTRPASVSGKTYNGSDYDLVSLIGLDPDWAQYLTLSVKRGTESITETRVSAAGTYTITCTPVGSLRNSVKWSDGTTLDKSVTVKIDPMYIMVVGWEDKPARPIFADDVSDMYYKVVYQTKDGDGNYTTHETVDKINGPFQTDIYASVEVSELMEGNLYIVYDEAAEMLYKFRMFQGNAKPIDRPSISGTVLEYNFDEQSFESLIENWRDIREYVTVLGMTSTNNPLTVDEKFIGTRTIRIALKSDQNVVWKGDPLKQLEIVEIEFEVAPRTLPEDWSGVDENGRPVLSFENMDVDFDISKIVKYEYYDAKNKPIKQPDQMKEGDKYKAVATIKDDYAKFFCFGKRSEEEGGTLIAYSEEYEFTFGVNEPPQEPDVPKDDNVDKPGEDTLNLPLWQLIVGGLSAVLFVFCTLKAFGEYGKLKTAKKEAKDLAAQSYATTYGFAPLGLLAVEVGLWGMGESTWTIIAFAALGLFLLSAVALFLLGKKRKAAELVVKREQARIAEEKEFAREEEQMRREEERRLHEDQIRAEMREEQARRDNEMKMMFAAMQQGGFQQAPFQYQDMQNMITSAVSALLPAMQQQMALPPAQSDPNAYAAPQSDYAARAENEALRAQLAAQEERMAQQQELLNQILQNQQQPAYEEEEVVDDVSWLGESDEVVSLEESYGALSDEAKRAYYEIGSYIMSKPRTSQNDGRYAVLFKYRRRTLFKLCIKDDAPVLYYPEGVGRGEIRIGDAAALGLARSMIDRNVARVDSELN